VGQKAVIFNDKNELLVLQRSERAGGGGKWALAGGALEEREAPVIGIQREITEETQLQVTKLKPFAILSAEDSDHDFAIIIGYTCVASNKEVVLNWEHDQFKWVTKTEALSMDLSAHARYFLEHLD